MTNWTEATAIGAAVISGSTLVSSLYLLWSLLRKGRGKLRVRLLLGMVISDLILGLVVFPSEISFLAGNQLVTGTAGCNAVAFLLTSVLFTQHLWTLSIAIATLLLLKYPLSRTTTFLDRYAWTAGPIIWTLALVHAGVWWACIGFSSSGNLCSYQSYLIGGGHLDAKDLMQFIPRAVVFVIIFAIYANLFKFLRRPDTIQLSSQFVSGSALSHQSSSGHTSGPLAHLGRLVGKKESAPVNPDAPWEALEFVQVGQAIQTGGQAVRNKRAHSPARSPFFNPVSSFNGMLSASTSSTLPTPTTSEVPPSAPEPDYSTRSSTRQLSDASSSAAFAPYTKRPSDAETVMMTPKLSFDVSDLDTSMVQAHHPLSSSVIHILPPVISELDSKGEIAQHDDDELFAALKDDAPLDPMASTDPRKPSAAQALTEFFREYQADDFELRAGETVRQSSLPQVSASTYFNRQASLLMLYFPLAYLLVFSVSMIRLIYSMSTSGPVSPVLSLISGLLVLSVGVVDGLVYGLAEFLVRRRVRKQMPDRL